MSKLKCYYAHGMHTYGSTIEQEDIKLLEFLGFEVINPNTPEIQEDMRLYISANGAGKTMEYFTELVKSCDLLAFRGLPSLILLSGVSVEIETALDLGKPVIELPCSLQTRMLDYPTTKRYLIELGHYKV